MLCVVCGCCRGVLLIVMLILVVVVFAFLLHRVCCFGFVYVALKLVIRGSLSDVCCCCLSLLLLIIIIGIVCQCLLLVLFVWRWLLSSVVVG